MQSEVVTVLIQLRLLTDCIEQGKADLLDLAREVSKFEPDCLAIELAQDMDDSTKVTMIEKWSSREAYEGPHMSSKRMLEFIDKSARFFVGPPEISFCRGTTINTT